VLNAKCDILYIPAQFLKSPPEFKRPLLLSNRGLVPVWPYFNILFFPSNHDSFSEVQVWALLNNKDGMLCQPVLTIVYWSQTMARMAAVSNNIHLIPPSTLWDELGMLVNCFPVLQSKALDSHGSVSCSMPTVSEDVDADWILSAQHSQ